jgi:hypothetical protein
MIKEIVLVLIREGFLREFSWSSFESKLFDLTENPV